MPALPSGTVTFVFSDIEGSTALLKQLGERYEGVLGDHRRLMREGFAERGGVEIDTQGDAFFFAFPRARDAVTAAVEAQRAHAAHDWPDGAVVRVRMGLHTGEPAVGSEGYLGLDVVRAARLCTAGKGGHVLLSDTTRALVGASLPEGVSIFPIGERQLKDLDEPERVFELEIEGASPPDVAHVTSATDVPASACLRPRRECRRDFGDRLAEQIEASVAARSGAVARARVLAGRRAGGPGGEAARDDHRAARGGRGESGRAPRGRRAAACAGALARVTSPASSRAAASPGRAPRDGSARISSANSARETASAPATCSGPAASSSASSSSARARSVTCTGLRTSFVKKVSSGSRAASSCFDGSAPP